MNKFFISIIFFVLGFLLVLKSQPEIVKIETLLFENNELVFSGIPSKFLAEAEFDNFLPRDRNGYQVNKLKMKFDIFSQFAMLQVLHSKIIEHKGFEILWTDGTRSFVKLRQPEIIFTMYQHKARATFDFSSTFFNVFTILGSFLMICGMFIFSKAMIKNELLNLTMLLFCVFLTWGFIGKHYLEFQNDGMANIQSVFNNNFHVKASDCEFCHHLPLGYMFFKPLVQKKDFYANKDFLIARVVSGSVFYVGIIIFLQILIFKFSVTKDNLVLYQLFLMHPFYLFNQYQISNYSLVIFLMILAILKIESKNEINFLEMFLGVLVKVSYKSILPLIFIFSKNKLKSLMSITMTLFFVGLISLSKGAPAFGFSKIFFRHDDLINNVWLTFINVSTLEELSIATLTSNSFDYTWIFLLKSSLFNELQFIGWQNFLLGPKIALILFWIYVFVLILVFSLLITKFKFLKEKKYIIGTFGIMLAFIYLIVSTRVQHSQNYRLISYIIFPIIIVLMGNLNLIISKFLKVFFYLLLFIKVIWAIYFSFNSFYFYY